MKTVINKLVEAVILLAILATTGFSQSLDLTNSEIVCIEMSNQLLAKAIAVLQEEIEKRSDIQLPISENWPNKSHPIIAVGLEKNLNNFPKEYQDAISSMRSIGSEGYKILITRDSKAALIVGHDPRGVLYGIGKLLRKMEIRKGQILVPSDLKIASTPAYAIRGHQLGYRPKTNSYDAWTVEQFDSYIRDLAVFGANSIEIMPPRTDDDFTSSHMKLPAIEMMSKQSKICDSYGLDVWMWYPNLGKDYTDLDLLKKEMEERHEVFKAIPRLDALFVPGGDPGDLEPDELFNWLNEVAAILHLYHPEAKIWVSPQVFRPTQKWFDSFYGHVNNEYPWFGGVVFGPWIKTPIEEIRKLVNPNIPIRRYPDITHSLSSQYPIPKWDLAYAITLGRECINPRPTDHKMIHNAFDQFAHGSISYSEGTNDDVNKMIWSDQDWSPESPVIETLRDYARYFISPDNSEEIAHGIMELERNLQGPLLINDGVDITLQQWQTIEKKASKKMLSNFRFQMCLIRAYFDAYQYRRLVYETELEKKARDILLMADKKGSLNAINEAEETLAKAHTSPIRPELKERCYLLADSLFKSIGAQLTVEKHSAMDGRGNFIDYIDIPLNDVMWLLDQFSIIKELSGEDERLQKIDDLLQRNNPGPNGFYDNFGSPKSWEKVISEKSLDKDPGSLLSPRVSFGVGLRGEEWVHQVTAKGFNGKSSPLSWMHQVTTLYDEPLEIVYDNLDSNRIYTIRVAYTGRFRSKMKLVADDILVHDFIQTGIQPIYEFPVPAKSVKDGIVNFKWTCGEGERGSQVSEIWLIKE